MTPSTPAGRDQAATPAALLRASPLPPLEARILLTHVLGWRQTQLITRADEALESACVERYLALQARRVAGEPVAQLVGVREFFGLEFEVTPHVLIPRPETELLVETALAAMENLARPRVLDLGTGTGAIAVAIAAMRPDAQVSALDRSAEALEVAARNAARLLDAKRPGGAVTFMQSDWYDSLKSTLRFDVIVSNPPYIASGDPHLTQGDLRYEPRGALTDEADGLSAIRAIVAGAPARLAPQGVLWMEHGYDQAQAVRALLTAQGFADVRSERDLAGIERISGGRLAG
ncbi:peptide chain release factor N(5)-glutamine methyltransferase [bacterium M00.F.Ca.ET.228.01.1.1]|uniref:peptide chain release factor N(5)-glutamine methyltransferase n=1 Tax=Paraburkholderia phenoliruptrix TaxID=252970 RepID=UPI001092D8DF|nr:peptide chain release factor N(5)-glutamine methyltransferase [Paraburkholderia phenoliruptrix]TGP40923.1 peptide chain release factor N(5)-glutamine methyltransferase [bacterium M00.F.Ca.ET.228.01.1.1]TGR97239.1 peptide chain release factor N(5)-glutamine methyltransferase [bacterium M00.F.Ca.ET.191.01.1.1]TGU01753.1 peptide chain release factor N(5)-glutamine methyltransferase [bacterium M00.F.Ca.ET.155.01.1.1]MBW0451016.1 peptide chain release factor N(5)-glutamine methyltransferase [Para